MRRRQANGESLNLEHEHLYIGDIYHYYRSRIVPVGILCRSSALSQEAIPVHSRHGYTQILTHTPLEVVQQSSPRCFSKGDPRSLFRHPIVSLCVDSHSCGWPPVSVRNCKPQLVTQWPKRRSPAAPWSSSESSPRRTIHPFMNTPVRVSL